MTVFVTGATGYIGAAVCESLIAHGHSVCGLARNEEASRRLQRTGVTPILGDLREPQSFKPTIAKASAVLHLAASSDNDTADRDAAAIDTILDAIRGTSKKFIYTSGLWVVGNTKGGVTDESAAFDPPQVAAWRIENERKVSAAANNDASTVIIRPGYVFGQAGGQVRMFFDSFRDYGSVRYIGDGANHWSCVHVEDLGRLYTLALEKAASGSMYFGVSGEAVRMKEIASAVAKTVGAPGKVESWSFEEARAELGWVAEGLVLDQTISSARAQSELGWHPGQPTIIEDILRGSYRASLATGA